MTTDIHNQSWNIAGMYQPLKEFADMQHLSKDIDDVHYLSRNIASIHCPSRNIASIHYSARNIVGIHHSFKEILPHKSSVGIHVQTYRSGRGIYQTNQTRAIVT